MAEPAAGAGGGSGDGEGAESDGEELDTEHEHLTERQRITRVVSAEVSVWWRIAEIWRCRELLVFLIRKEISVKYKNSFFGFVWSMLNPAMTLAIYVVVFQGILKNGIPLFAIYLWSGMLVWNLFQTGVQTGTSVIVGNAGIVKKVAFPREILALAAVGTAMFFFFFQTVVMVGFLVGFTHAPDWGLLWLLIPALLTVTVLACALSVFLSAVNVFLRDTQHLIDVVLVAWFWACPIVYKYQQIAGSGFVKHHRWVLWLYLANPVTPMVLTFQRVFYRSIAPLAPSGPKATPGHPTPLPILPTGTWRFYLGLDGIVLVVSAALFVGALAVFGRLEGNFAEEL